MPVVPEADVRAALAAGQPAPVYVLLGDDAVAKQPLLDAFEALIEPDLRPFNTHRFYADEKTSVVDVVATARTLPLLAPRRVVIVMRADAWFRSGAGDRGGDDDATAEQSPAVLEAYLAAPEPQTCLVLVAGDVNRTLRQTRALLRHAQVVEFWGLKEGKELRGEAAVRRALAQGKRFAVERLAAAGLRAEPEAIDALLQSTGTDVAALRDAIARLSSYAAGTGRVTVEDVRAVVSGAVVLDDWALTRALSEGNARAALRQLRLQLEEGQSPFKVLGQLGWWVRTRLPTERESALPAAVERLLRADLDLKSSADSRLVLERLVVELCDAVRRA